MVSYTDAEPRLIEESNQPELWYQCVAVTELNHWMRPYVQLEPLIGPTLFFDWMTIDYSTATATEWF